MVRLPLTFVLTTFTLVTTLAACNGEPDGPVESPPSTQSPAKSTLPPSSGSGGTQAPAPSGSSSTSSSSGSTSGSKSGAPANPADPADPAKDPGKDPQAADPACVQSCGANGGLKAKCQGDDTFCDDVCAAYTAAEITCLTSAPTCEKSEWIRCEGN